MDLWTRVGAYLEGLASSDAGAVRGGRVGAALVLLREVGDGDLEIVYTRRRDDLRSHPGQISFPGGRVDPGESVEQAAVREAAEEVALDPASVEVLGRLPVVYIPPSRFWLVPVLARWRAAHRLVPGEDEVDQILHVRLSTLTDPDTWRVVRLSTSGWSWAWQLDRRHLLWGATGMVTSELLEVLAPGWHGGRVPEELGATREATPWDTRERGVPRPGPPRLAGVPERPINDVAALASSVPFVSSQPRSAGPGTERRQAAAPGGAGRQAGGPGGEGWQAAGRGADHRQDAESRRAGPTVPGRGGPGTVPGSGGPGPTPAAVAAAGRVVADAVSRLLAQSPVRSPATGAHAKPRILVLVGAGGKGRAGLAAAGRLAAEGQRIEVILTRWTEPARQLADAGLDDRVAAFAGTLPAADLVVDALVGSGLRGSLGGTALDILLALRHQFVPVLSLDLPTGLHPEEGLVGDVLPADVTIAFGAPRGGLLHAGLGPFVGDLYVAKLDADGPALVRLVPGPERAREGVGARGGRWRE